MISKETKSLLKEIYLINKYLEKKEQKIGDMPGEALMLSSLLSYIYSFFQRIVSLCSRHDAILDDIFEHNGEADFEERTQTLIAENKRITELEQNQALQQALMLLGFGFATRWISSWYLRKKTPFVNSCFESLRDFSYLENVSRKDFNQVIKSLRAFLKQVPAFDPNSNEHWLHFLKFLKQSCQVEILSHLKQMGACPPDLSLDVFEKVDANVSTHGKGENALLWLAAKAINQYGISLPKELGPKHPHKEPIEIARRYARPSLRLLP